MGIFERFFKSYGGFSHREEPSTKTVPDLCSSVEALGEKAFSSLRDRSYLKGTEPLIHPRVEDDGRSMYVVEIPESLFNSFGKDGVIDFPSETFDGRGGLRLLTGSKSLRDVPLHGAFHARRGDFLAFYKDDEKGEVRTCLITAENASHRYSDVFKSWRRSYGGAELSAVPADFIPLTAYGGGGVRVFNCGKVEDMRSGASVRLMSAYFADVSQDAPLHLRLNDGTVRTIGAHEGMCVSWIEGHPHTADYAGSSPDKAHVSEQLVGMAAAFIGGPMFSPSDRSDIKVEVGFGSLEPGSTGQSEKSRRRASGTEMAKRFASGATASLDRGGR